MKTGPRIESLYQRQDKTLLSLLSFCSSSSLLLGTEIMNQNTSERRLLHLILGESSGTTRISMTSV